VHIGRNLACIGLSVPSKRVETLPRSCGTCHVPLFRTFSTLKAGRDSAAMRRTIFPQEIHHFQYPQSGSRLCRDLLKSKADDDLSSFSTLKAGRGSAALAHIRVNLACIDLSVPSKRVEPLPASAGACPVLLFRT